MLKRIEDYSKVLPIVEVYTAVQSEGSRQGYPTIVVRTSGCTHRCYFGEGGWCDSWYTSIHPEKGKYTFNDIIKMYDENPHITEMMLTGGSPTMHPSLVNELTHLFIEGIKNTKLATSVSFRISEKSPPEYIRKTVELHRDTNGPAYFNDEIAVKTLMNDGYALEAARDYCLVGCVEPNGSGDTFGATGGSKIYFPTVLDLVFNRGVITFFGNFDTIDTGDPVEFTTFDEFMDAYNKQMDYMVAVCAKATNIRDDIWAEFYHNPLISCTIDGCIENAADETKGSALYNFGAIGAGGLGTVVDSLAAIKKFVYEEKSIEMKDLVKAIQHNFKGYEELRQKLGKNARNTITKSR